MGFFRFRLACIECLTWNVCFLYAAAMPREDVMRKWILFGALILGLVELEWGLERWADQIGGDSKAPAQSMDGGPWPIPTPEPSPR